MTTPPDRDLRPYLAPLLLRRSSTGSLRTFTDRLEGEVLAIVAADARNGAVVCSSPWTHAGVNVRTIEYLEVRAPAWDPAGSRMDVTHQLIVIATRRGFAGICATQAGMADRIASAPCVRPLERGLVERAFVGTRASVLWLSGIHAKTDAKPTAKTLMGTALEYALDPLGDQSFFYSAARSVVDLGGTGGSPTSMGANPANSRIWIGRTKGLEDFANRIAPILERCAAPPSSNAPFAALAKGIDDLSAVGDAYEVGLVPPELLENVVDGTDVEDAETWAYLTDFDVRASAGCDVDVEVTHAGTPLGIVRLSPSIANGRTDVATRWISRTGAPEPIRELCSAHLEDGRWLRVRYGSGHVLANRGCYLGAYTDRTFDWQFKDLSGWKVGVEKPAVGTGQTLAGRIGTSPGPARDDSLFGYVFDCFRHEGWLASDDGSMEIADFVHIADDGLVTLVHVKAAGSDKADRQVSASKYEVVTGQAIKNLRHLQGTTLAEALRRNGGNQIGAAVWHAGAPQGDRSKMIARAAALRPDHPRRLVILQPQLTKGEHDACAVGGGATPGRMLRMKQLHTLMLAARLSAGATGTTFEAWAAL